MKWADIPDEPKGSLKWADIPDEPVDAPPEQSPEFSAATIAEPALTAVTGAIAEPIAGLAGLATLPFGGAGRATENIEDVRRALTYAPRTPEGQAGLQKMGEFLEPVGKAIETVEKGAGDIAYEATGSPLAGALGQASPTAALAALGAAPIRRMAKMGKKARQASKAKGLLKKASPDIDDLKTEARNIYKQIDESGAVVKSDATARMVDKITSTMMKEGFDPDLHPKIAVTLKRLDQIKGTDQPVGKLDTLRKIANSAAGSLDPSEKRLGMKVIGVIDDTLDDLKVKDFANGKEVGSLYKDARGLWARTKRSEHIKEAFIKAKNQASGFENGIRTQFRSILNNKKKRASFSPEEIKTMENVIQGGKIENMAKMLGKFGFSEGQASNMLMGSLGVGAGAAIGGAPGAIAVPLIGQVSRKLAQRLTKGNAEFADAVIRAGKDGLKITNEYLKRVPAKEQSAKELSQLLLRSEASLKQLKQLANKAPQKQRALLKEAIITAEATQSLKQKR